MTKDEMAKYIMDMYDQQNKTWMHASDEDGLTMSADSADSYTISVDGSSQWDEEEDYQGVEAEYATTLMDELTANNLDSHVLLKYPEIANWWGNVLRHRKQRADALRKHLEDEHARKSLIARLTPEEKRLLGVK